MRSLHRRATALLLSAFAAAAMLVLPTSPAHAEISGAQADETGSSSTGPLGGLLGDGGLVTVFIGNYQVNN